MRGEGMGCSELPKSGLGIRFVVGMGKGNKIINDGEMIWQRYGSFSRIRAKPTKVCRTPAIEPSKDVRRSDFAQPFQDFPGW